jgi:dihydrolipoamide dehydrogenase
VPNGKMLDAEKAGVAVNERGFIEVDKQLRTNVATSTPSATSSVSPCWPTRCHEGHVAAKSSPARSTTSTRK